MLWCCLVTMSKSSPAPAPAQPQRLLSGPGGRQLGAWSSLALLLLLLPGCWELNLLTAALLGSRPLRPGSRCWPRCRECPESLRRSLARPSRRSSFL